MLCYVMLCYVREGRGGMVKAMGFVIAAACRAGLNPAWGRFVGRFQCQWYSHDSHRWRDPQL